MYYSRSHAKVLTLLKIQDAAFGALRMAAAAISGLARMISIFFTSALCCWLTLSLLQFIDEVFVSSGRFLSDSFIIIIFIAAALIVTIGIKQQRRRDLWGLGFGIRNLRSPQTRSSFWILLRMPSFFVPFQHWIYSSLKIIEVVTAVLAWIRKEMMRFPRGPRSISGRKCVPQIMIEKQRWLMHLMGIAFNFQWALSQRSIYKRN